MPKIIFSALFLLGVASHASATQPCITSSVDLSEIHRRIQSAVAPVALCVDDNRVVRVLPKPVRSNLYELVYRVAGTGQELWVAQASERGQRRMQQRQALFKHWSQYEALPIALPAWEFPWQTPVILLVESGTDELLLEMFYRRFLIEVTEQGPRVHPDGAAVFAKDNEGFAFLWSQLFGIGEMNAKDSAHALSLRSDRIGLKYLDAYYAHFGALAFTDLMSATPEEMRKGKNGLSNYLEEAAQIRSVAPKTLAFDEVQARDYLRFITLAGEEVRVCGLDAAIQQRIIERTRRVLLSFGVTQSRVFYYGSRVMPRTEVLERDPSLHGRMPTAKDGLAKTSVRIGGATQISDLEMVVTYSSLEDLSEPSQLAIKDALKAAVNEEFYLFPIGLKSQVVSKGLSAIEEFNVFAKTMESHGKYLSPFQFIEAT